MARRADDALAAQRKALFCTVALHRLRACQPLQNGADGRVGAKAHNGVHLRDLFDDLMLVTLRQTTCYDHLQLRLLFLIGTGLQNAVDGLLLGTFDEAAGVHDDGVGLGEVGGGGMAALQQSVTHHVGIHLVFGTAEGNQCNYHNRLPC